MRTLCYFLAVLAIAATIPVVARAQSVQWQKPFGANGNDEAYTVIETSDGGYLLTGYTTGPLEQFTGIIAGYVVKTDAAGNKEWEYSTGTNEFTSLHAAFEVADGYMLFGESKGLYVITLDRNGKLVRDTTIVDVMRYAIPTAITRTSDSGFAILATSFNDTTLLLLRLSSAGQLQWSRTYKGYQASPSFMTDGNQSEGIAQTSDGGFLITGYVIEPKLQSKDGLVLRLNNNGDVVWKTTYGRPSTNEEAIYARQTDSGFVVAGYDGIGAQMVALNPNGNVRWSRVMPGMLNFTSIHTTSDGDLLVVSGGSGVYGDTVGARIWKVNVSGQVLATLVGYFANDIASTSDGGYILAGNVVNINDDPIYTDALLIKLANIPLDVPRQSNQLLEMDLSEKR